MNRIKLTKTWETFKAELQEMIEKGEALKNAAINSLEEFQQQESKRIAWDQKVFALIKESCSNDINPMAIELNNIAANNFNVPNDSFPLKELIFQFKGRLQIKTQYLFFKMRILDVCDLIVCPENVYIAERSHLTLKQKQQFILDKLFALYDDNYYPIEEILHGNGVNLNREGEANELVEILENNGYVEARRFAGSKVHAKLTVVGYMFIEEAHQPATENYNDIHFSPSELVQKMDEIKDELDKLGLGHEILYNEMEELKNLYKTLNKKNWGQLLKGKLLDIAVGKLVDNATISFVYEALTDHKLKLL